MADQMTPQILTSCWVKQTPVNGLGQWPQLTLETFQGCIRKHSTFKRLCRTFLRKHCIQCATVGLVYAHAHTYVYSVYTYFTSPSAESDGRKLQMWMFPTLNVMVGRASLLAQVQSSLCFLSHYVKIFKFPLRLSTHLLLNRVQIHFFLCHSML